MNPITLRLPYCISANRYWTQARGHIIVSAEAKQYRRDCHLLAIVAGVRKPVSVPIAIDITLIPPEWVTYCPKGKMPTQRKAGPPLDLDNSLKVLIDAFKGVIYDDDDQIKDIHACYGDRSKSGALIVRISEFIPEPIGLFAQP